MTKWTVQIDTNKKVHEYTVRETFPAPYVGIEIARINPYDIHRRKSHAYLIAAAPEMLALLKAILLRDDITSAELIKEINTVVDMAEGDNKP